MLPLNTMNDITSIPEFEEAGRRVITELSKIFDYKYPIEIRNVDMDQEYISFDIVDFLQSENLNTLILPVQENDIVREVALYLHNEINPNYFTEEKRLWHMLIHDTDPSKDNQNNQILYQGMQSANIILHSMANFAYLGSQGRLDQELHEDYAKLAAKAFANAAIDPTMDNQLLLFFTENMGFLDITARRLYAAKGHEFIKTMARMPYEQVRETIIDSIGTDIQQKIEEV
tara:strand:- start:4466 stop:5155 length:690 start_codon:yes stop_codon:yes gene_type:complete